MSAIGCVVEPLKAVSLKFYDGNESEVTDRELAAFWRRPARGMRYEEFIDATAVSYLIHGEFFWLLDESWMLERTRYRRNPFIVARPDRMREVVRGGELLGWVWTDAAGRQETLLPESVIHVKRWNPLNDWRGLGQLQAALLAAETDFTAGRFARDTYANAGQAGDYVTAKGGIPTEAQQQQIEMALREKRAAARRGDFKIAFLSGDLEVKAPSFTAPDAAFVANRISNRHEVFAAFRVPMSMADVAASYSIGSASDYFRLIFGASMPLGQTIGGAIESLAEAMTGKAGVEAWFDWDEHPVMQEVRRERIDAADKLWSKGMPMEAINDYLDMGLSPFAGWEVGYLPFSVAPVDAGAATAPASSGNEPASAAEPLAAMIRMLEQKATTCANKAAERDPRRVALARQHAAARRPMEKAFLAKITKTLMPARAEVLRKIEGAKAKALAVGKAAAADFNFDLTKFREALKAELRKQGRNALDAAGAEMLAELGRDDVWAMPPADVLRFLTVRENLIADAADEIHAQIEGSLMEGLDAGETMDQLAERVRQAFAGIQRGRAMTIAATETAVAYGVARHTAMEQAGVQWKQWLTAADGAVRHSHEEVEGETVPLFENFSNGLAFPGDPEGPAAEVINCRCVQIAVASPEEPTA